MNTYRPILEQNVDLFHPFSPSDVDGVCRWCDVPQDKHLCPHYHLVPKSLDENLAFRLRLIDLARAEPGARGAIRRMCAEDILFYVNAVCWIFEPRDAAEIPFITYPFQDEALLVIQDSIGKCDLVVEKSRDMGASWCCITAIHHPWMFHGRQTSLMLSRKEELVDKSGDPKSLFWKFDYLTDHLPSWLSPDVEAMKMHRANLVTGASADGESTNEFAGVADRRRTILLDEFSKMPNQDLIVKGTRDVTRSRIFLFTPQGSANEAYRVAHNPNFRKLSLHWHYHPVKAKGLYRVGAGGEPELLDRDYWTPERVSAYEFVRTQPQNPRYHYRSPWYDDECKRAVNQKEIAEELDIDYLASNFLYYPQEVIDALLKETAREPILRGTIEIDREVCKVKGFTENENGLWKLWIRPDETGQMPFSRRFVVGCDVSMGTGGEYSSQSALSVVDRRTGEKVAEYADSTIAPHELARLGVSVCRWFQGMDGEGALFIWEYNGPGQMLGREVLKVGYGHIYYREKNEKSRRPRPSDIPGFWSSDGPEGTRATAHAGYRRALVDRRFVNRSADALRQTLCYVLTSERKIEHQASLASGDPAQSGANHGDIVVADMLACLCLDERKPEQEVVERAPTSSVWHRIRESRRSIRSSVRTY